MLRTDTGPLAADDNSGASGLRPRIPKFLLAAIAAVVLIGAGLGAGRIMWGSNDTAPAPTAAPETTAPSAPDPNVLTPTQAKQQACDGYAMLGTQWASGYTDWHAIVVAAGPGWSWDAPPIKAATDKFFGLQSEIVFKLRSLITPVTPQLVGTAVNRYTAALMSFAVVQNSNVTGAEIDAKVNAINSAADSVIQNCGL
ncbi:hypothetical protein [Mycobacteroides abscessus]|uniref:Uncharacterized protein n=1 Tax=Mycobacteroides abscessus TaxID=36809 RepID=A0A0U0ZSY2_9MYCO|nr:hypothetical protein [Mycobacteroides abscessus]CPV66662.1 Uncharacterised protein [Mycobacteroides abscessus]